MASIQRHLKINSSSMIFGRINWLGTLALLGTLLLFIGVSLSSAGVVEDKILPKIMKQLDDQGKNIESTSVMDTGSGAEITITLKNGEVRKYNNKGQPTKVIDSYGKVTLYEDGMPTEEQDASGSVISRTKYFKSSSGKLQKMVKRSAAGVVTKLFDDDGNAVQATDSQGTKVFANYVKNDKGKTVSYVETDLATNKTITNILNPKNGEVIAKIDPNNIRTDIEYQYNENGEKIGVVERDTAGNVVTKKYENGQMIEETRNGIKTTFENIVNEKGVLVEKKEIKMMPSASGMIENVTTKKYDEQGRVIESDSMSGRVTYTYETNAEGRIIARNEKTEPKDGTQPTEKLTLYDESGKVVGTKSDNSETKITNVVDDQGNLISSSETIIYKFGGQVYSSVVSKKYDDNGNIISETDQYGNQTQNTYDGNGNRIETRNEESVTQYTYDDANRLVSSVSKDRKSTTITDYNEETKLAEQKVLIKNSGVVEVTTYGISTDGKRTSYTQTPFGIKVTINRDATSDQPEKSTFSKFNGKVIITTYQYAGEHMITSKEEGPDGVTDTNYNGSGQPIETYQTDKWGNKKVTLNEYAKGKISHALLTDNKGKTTTIFNKDGDPKKIVRENKIGYPRKTEEDRTYKDGMLSSSTSYDVKGKTITYYDENELPSEVHRINYHGFPREHWTYNFYDAGGDIESSIQVDDRGHTQNAFNIDGQMEKSVRTDVHGFPKGKTTSYTYDEGELVSSTTDTDRYTDHNKFDVDGLMRETQKEKKFGYPRSERTTYEYDANAYMTFSLTQDVNGTTENYYNIDELVSVSHRVNTYGHAREQWTVNLYDGAGYLTNSKETDLKGCTMTEFDIDGLAVQNVRLDQYGVVYSRDTLTVNEYDGNGFMTTAMSKNLLTTTRKEFDKDSLVQYSEQNDNFGLLDGRYKVSDRYDYDEFGRIQTSTSEDDLGKTISSHDIHGDAIETIRFGKVGLYASRETVTQSEFQADTGMTTYRMSKSAFGTTESSGFDPRTGLESVNKSMNNYGLKGSLYSVTEVDMDVNHGLQRYSNARTAIGETETFFDTQSGGSYGIAVMSKSHNWYGLKGALETVTEITASKNNGISEETLAKNELGITKTKYQEIFGNAIQSETENFFGLKGARSTTTEIISSEYHGITEFTHATTELGETQTWYAEGVGNALRSVTDNKYGLTGATHTETEIDSSDFHGITNYTDAVNEISRVQTYYVEGVGNAMKSVADNKFGLAGASHTETMIDSSDFNGITEYTDARNDISRVQTYYVKGVGNAEKSETDNKFGLLGARHTVTEIDSSDFNGLNVHTVAVNDISKVETDEFDEQYGTPLHTITTNVYGLLGAQITETDITSNTFNGLNILTVATNDISVVTTDKFDEQYGTPLHSRTQNKFGLEGAADTSTNITTNSFNGLNILTVATNDISVVTTDKFDEQYGTPLHSDTHNKFGLIGAQDTSTNITTNPFNGLNTLTVAENDISKVTTDKFDSQYGTPLHSNTFNKYGLTGAESTSTNITTNPFNGLNTRTVAENDISTVTTDKFDEQYGTPLHSNTFNKFGLIGAQDTSTDITTNAFNGLNILTVAENDISKVTTDRFHEQYGTPLHSDTFNKFGLIGAQNTSTDIITNPLNGLNTHTLAVNDISTVETDQFDEQYGTPLHSITTNVYGLIGAQVTETDITTNSFNGLNTHTVASNAISTVTTDQFDPQYGTPLHSDTFNKYGLTGAQNTSTSITTNPFNGLNTLTVAENDVSRVTTDEFHTQYGTPLHSDTFNKFGLTGAQDTSTDITTNSFNGLNTLTVAENDISKVTTDRFDEQYGTPLHSDTFNKYGLIGAQDTSTDITTNPFNGLNTLTVAENDISKVTTDRFDEQYGTPLHSDTFNKFGLTGAENTSTDITTNPFNGLNTLTVAENNISKVTTDQFHTQYGTPLHSHTFNKFGLTGAENTYTDITTNSFNGLNTLTVAENEVNKVTTDQFHTQYGTPLHSHTFNKFGLTGAENTYTDITTNSFNGLNTHTLAKNDISTVETDQFHTQYGTPLHSITTNVFGLLGAQVTNTDITTNSFNGLNTLTVADNAISTVTTDQFDTQYGTPLHSNTLNKFGLTGATNTSTDITTNSHNGLNTLTVTENDISKVTTDQFHTQYGTPLHSHTFNKFGLKGAENTYTDITTNSFNGLNTLTVAENEISKVTTDQFHTQYGTPLHSHTFNKFGLTGAENTYTDITTNPFNGLNTLTVAENDISKVTTDQFHTQYGTPLHSDTVNKFGLTGATNTSTDITTNSFNGLNTLTVAENAISKVTTDRFDEQYGTPLHSDTFNKFGLTGAENTSTDITTNSFNGLNTLTVAENDISKVITDQFDTQYGTPLHSDTFNKFGLTGAENTSTNITTNPFNGLNTLTVAENDISKVTTDQFHTQYGTPLHSHTFNKFGLTGAENTYTDITTNSFNGLNTHTLATNEISTVETDQFHTQYGTPLHSITTNVYGLTGAQVTNTDIVTNSFNGLNTHTMATNAISTVETDRFDEQYGTPLHSITTNVYGLLGAQVTNTDITTNSFNGLNTLTVAENDISKVTTDVFDTQYGTPLHSDTFNKYGLTGAENTSTDITTNPHNGLNTLTVAENDISKVTTDEFHTQYGTPLHSHTFNKYGLTGAENTYTNITTNSFNGLNTLTVAENEISKVTTDQFHTQYGTPLHSDTFNKFGLTGAESTSTNITTNPFNGLNTLTVAENAISKVTTDVFHTQYGTPLHSDTVNKFGLTGATNTSTDITTNSFNGLNTLTVADNAISTVTTDKFDEQYGTPLHSDTFNKFGLTGAENTSTDITTNPFNGLNTLTVAENDISKVTTDVFHTQYGTPLHSDTFNKFGLTGAENTSTDITTNSFNGLNTRTVADNAISTVTTDEFHTQYGTPLHSDTFNKFGLTGAENTSTDITTNSFNGLNTHTLATNDISTVETDEFHTQYGTPLHSITTNVYGLTGASVTNTDITTNSFNGLNTHTMATNAISTVETDEFDAQYGTALHSITTNVYGLTGATVTETDITSNSFNGLNTHTIATNAISTVETDEFDTQYGTPLHSITTNVYGLVGAQVTNTNITTNPFNGLNTNTLADNAISTVNTDEFHTQYGTPLHSHTFNKKGLTGAENTYTDITTNSFNGLNTHTMATNDISTVETDVFDTQYGTPLHSITTNVYGLTGAAVTDTEITTNPFNGLNTRTVATNDISTVDTYEFDAQYGTPLQSLTTNVYGLTGATETETDITTNEFDGLNTLTIAENAISIVETDVFDTQYGTPLHSITTNVYGLTGATVTETDITTNSFNGLNTHTVATNAISTVDTDEYHTQYGTPLHSITTNVYGLTGATVTETAITTNPFNGLNTMTIAENDISKVTTDVFHTQYGTPLHSDTINKYGLTGATNTSTDITTNPFNGLNTRTVAKNAISTVDTYEFDPQFGTPLRSITTNVFGLTGATVTNTDITTNSFNGLNTLTIADNAISTVTTDEFDSQYGTPLHSDTVNKYGLTGATNTSTNITTNPFNGLNTLTVAENAISKVTTDVFHTQYGTPLHSDTFNKFGLTGAENTSTNITTNPFNGLNTLTVAENAISKVTTDQFHTQYGTPLHSHTFNKFGLTGAENTYTDITTNSFNGLNTMTVAENDISKVTTDVFHTQYGTPLHSQTFNKYGLTGAQDTSTNITTNPFNGLNTLTVADNAISTVTTDVFHTQYGTPLHSDTVNKYGLTGATNTSTDITTNSFNGLNTLTVADNAISTVTTDEFHTQYGTPLHSDTVNKYGLTGATNTSTNITTNSFNGLNTLTVADNAVSTVTTDQFHTQYGTPLHSHTFNKYGLTGAENTYTDITTNSFNGLNTMTVAENDISKVTTDVFHTQYGTPLHSQTFNKYGLTGAEDTSTDITTNSFNGLNTLTVADNAISTVTTDVFHTQYGTPLHSDTVNKYGLTGATNTSTNITTNSFNGLNTLTVADNAISTVTTDVFHTQYGTPLHSDTVNKYGLTGATNTSTDITTNSFNGLNTLTVADNAISTVTTDKYHTQYGTPLHSDTVNKYGLTGATNTSTNITTNSFNGLNTLTVADNAISTVTTDEFHTQYGTPLHSDTFNKFGLTGAANTSTNITTNSFNGLNTHTFATCDINTVETDQFDVQYGTPLHSITTNVYGLTGAAVTNTDITTNSFNGLNTRTVADNAISTVTTDVFHTQYGTPLHSDTFNKFGLIGAQNTSTDITTNSFNGLNTLTVAENDISRVTTNVFHTQYGTPLHSDTFNKYGLTGAQNTSTDITTNSFNGLNTLTVAENDISRVTTDQFHTQYGTPLHTHTFNKFGLTGAQETSTNITTNSFNGLNTHTLASNNINTVETDQFHAQYGTPLHSITTNVYGLTGAAVTNTNITTNPFNGLNTHTLATNAINTVETDQFHTQYGTPLHSITTNNYGLTGATVTNTNITTNSFNGLNTLTVADNAISTVTTDEFHTQYGTPLHSDTFNKFGLIGAANTSTNITTNPFNGLNTLTVAENDISRVTTDQFHTQYGTPLHSDTFNKYGLTGATNTSTNITTNSFNGLNTHTLATNDISTVETDQFDAQYGTPLHSITTNVYGLTGATVTNTAITTNPFNGLNTHTLATNAISTVETDQFDAQYGTPLHSITTNNYGLTGATITNTTITTNPFNGLNTLTVADNAISTVTTDQFHTQYGTPLHSNTFNKFGLLGAQNTDTIITSNPVNGLNTRTVAENDVSRVTTDQFHSQYGTPLHSDTYNKFGLTGATNTSTNIIANPFNGLSTYTVATNAISTIETDQFDAQYGTPLHTVSNNVYGLMGSRITNTDITTNPFNGLNLHTVADNAISTVTTDVFHAQYGTPLHSDTFNKYGLTGAQNTSTNITTNPNNGLNTLTVAESAISIVTTDAFDTQNGTPKHSITANKYGLLGASSTSTNIIANGFNGLNVWTQAVNTVSTVTTDVFDSLYGTPLHTNTFNNFGLTGAKNTSTNITTNPLNGLNTHTVADNAISTVTTDVFDTQFGTPKHSHTFNKFGLTGAENTYTIIAANSFNGLNIWTVADNDISTVKTDVYDAQYGTAKHSHTFNKYGLTGSKNTYTDITANVVNGLNITTVAVNELNTLTTTYDAQFGLPVQSVQTNDDLPSLAQITTTDIVANTFNGLNIFTTAENGLSTVITDAFDPQHGNAIHSITYNKYYAGEGNSQAETIITSNTHTGINQATYTITGNGSSWLSQTWTNYESQYGTQTDAISKMNADWTLLGAVDTQIIYNCNTHTGKMSNQTSTNHNGISTTYYDSNGLGVLSENWATYGLGEYTKTVLTPNNATGFNASTDATSYSRIDSGQIISTTHTDLDMNGRATNMSSHSTTGATLAQDSTSEITGFYEFTGSKKTVSSSTAMGDSVAQFNQKGVETTSENNSDYGPTAGRTSIATTMAWNETSGIVTSKQSSSGLTLTHIYTDDNGMPAGLWKKNESFYGPADGSKRSDIFVTSGIQWSGQPSSTVTNCDGFSMTFNTLDINGFNTHSDAYNKYGSNGSQQTSTDYDVNPATGMNATSNQVRCNGKGSTYTEYDGVKGTATKSVDTNEDGDKTTTTFETSDSTGMTTSSDTTGDNHYHEYNTTYDSQGRKTASRTSKDKRDGKKRKTEIYDSRFRNNDWTGFKEYEWRTNVQRSETVEIQYDLDGVEIEEKVTDYEYPSGEVEHLTEYSGSDADGNPTSSVTTFSGGGMTTRTVEAGGFVNSQSPDRWNYMPTYENITFHQGTYITYGNISYVVDKDGPTSATMTDDKGTETWTMDHGYENSAWTSRVRTNNGGSTITWNYTSSVDGPFHTSSTITYSDLYGTHTGTGSEEYTESGILTSRTLSNDTTMNMDLTFSNDGQYLTTATGTREDGQTVNYIYAGMNEIVSQEDDKGITTWDQANQKMQETSGNVGTFTYTYTGDHLEQIDGVSAIDGTMVYDEYWNMEEWTDSMGVVHSYSGTSTNKGYWTQATETFTDKGGALWTGEMNYDAWGFYFAGGELTAEGATVDGTGAVNTVDMEDGEAVTFIQGLLVDYHTENETWTYTSSSDTRGKKTLGELQSELLTTDALSQLANVKVTINPDGSTSTEFDTIKFMEANFTKRNRYKPVSSSSSKTCRSSVPSSTYSASQADNPFYSGSCGYKIKNVSSYPYAVGSHTESRTRMVDVETCSTDADGVETCTTTQEEESYTVTVTDYETRYDYTKVTYTKAADGWMWEATGGSTENAFDDTLVQDTGMITAAPVGEKSGNVSASSVSRTYRKSTGNLAGGVTLAGGMGTEQAMIMDKMTGELVPVGTESEGVSAATVAADLVVEEEESVESTKTKIKASTKGKSKGEGKGKAKTDAASKDELLVAFQEIDSMEDALAFIQMVRGKMDRKAIAKSLSTSRAAKVMNRLAKMYQRVFGEAQQATLLGKLTSMLLDNTLVLDEISVAITGGKAISADLKMAAKIAEKVEDAKEVERDEEGRVVQAIDQKGSQHKFEYEKSGITETVVAADGKTSVKHYDQSGKMLSEASGDVSRTFKYSTKRNGEIEKTTVVERSEEGTKTLEYNKDGLLTAVEKDGLRTEITYKGKSGDNYTAKLFNENGDVIEEQTFKNGKLAKKKMRDGTKVSYDYMTDGDGDVLAVTQIVEDSDGEKTYLKFDKSGKLVSVLGKDAERFTKMTEEGEMLDEALDFDATLELFSDPRMDGMRIDSMKLQGLEE